VDNQLINQPLCSMHRMRLFSLYPPRITAESFLESYREKWLVPKSFEDCHKDILHIQEEQFPSSPDFSVQKWLPNIDYECHRKLALAGKYMLPNRANVYFSLFCYLLRQMIIFILLEKSCAGRVRRGSNV
jgi:hypothetical protein